MPSGCLARPRTAATAPDLPLAARTASPWVRPRLPCPLLTGWPRCSAVHAGGRPPRPRRLIVGPSGCPASRLRGGRGGVGRPRGWSGSSLAGSGHVTPTGARVFALAPGPLIPPHGGQPVAPTWLRGCLRRRSGLRRTRLRRGFDSEVSPSARTLLGGHRWVPWKGQPVAERVPLVRGPFACLGQAAPFGLSAVGCLQVGVSLRCCGLALRSSGHCCDRRPPGPLHAGGRCA